MYDNWYIWHIGRSGQVTAIASRKKGTSAEDALERFAESDRRSSRESGMGMDDLIKPGEHYLVVRPDYNSNGAQHFLRWAPVERPSHHAVAASLGN